MASIFPRGRVWWILYYEHGRKIQKSLKTRDEKVAKYRKNEIENRLAKGDSPLPDTSMPLLALLDEYVTQSKAIKTVQTNRDDAARLRAYFNGAAIRNLNQITQSNLSKYIAHKIEDDKISPNTSNCIIKNVRAFINWAIRNNYATTNQLSGMARYKTSKLPPRYFSKDEINAVLAAAQAAGIGDFATTAIYTGMRFSELVRLTWGDIDFTRDEITVRISKSGKFRVIPLHPELKRQLKPAAGPKASACFSMTGKDGYKPYYHKLAAIIGQAEKILSKRTKEKYDFGRIGWHTFRHTFASHLIMSGVDLVTVSKLLGHADIKTTMIYSHLSQEHLRDGVKKLSF